MSNNSSEFKTCIIQIEKMSDETLEMFKARRSDILPKTNRIILRNHKSLKSSELNNCCSLKKKLMYDNEITNLQLPVKPIKEKNGIIKNLKMIF